MSKEIKDRLEYLRGEILAERISYSEIAELQSLAGHIDGDVLLLEWAGVPEFSEDCPECGNKIDSEYNCCTNDNCDYFA